MNRNEAGIEENANSQYNIAVNLAARLNAFQSWEDYQIPWNKVSAYDLEQLNRGMKNDQLKTNVVKVIISNARFMKVDIEAFSYSLQKI